jgi:hypothetical protein
MKYNIQNLALLSAVIAFAACESNKKSTINDSGDEVVKVRTPTQDTLNKDEKPAADVRTVEGKVIDTNHGKDGYTAKIETAENEIYAVTISHSNLKDPKQYKEAKAGEMLKVTGDFWKMGEENQITVRVID